jgi:hypothetical protein
VTALGLVALSLPAFLVYAVLSQSEEDEEA